jgi:hypothetical protein
MTSSEVHDVGIPPISSTVEMGIDDVGRPANNSIDIAPDNRTSILAARHTITELGGYRFDRAVDLKKDTDDGNQPVVWVDVHTELGRYGRYSVLTTNSDELGGGGSGGDERSRT